VKFYDNIFLTEIFASLTFALSFASSDLFSIFGQTFGSRLNFLLNFCHFACWNLKIWPNLEENVASKTGQINVLCMSRPSSVKSQAIAPEFSKHLNSFHFSMKNHLVQSETGCAKLIFTYMVKKNYVVVVIMLQLLRDNQGQWAKIRGGSREGDWNDLSYPLQKCTDFLYFFYKFQTSEIFLKS